MKIFMYDKRECEKIAITRYPWKRFCCVTLPCHQPKHQFNFLRWVGCDGVIGGFKALMAVTL